MRMEVVVPPIRRSEVERGAAGFTLVEVVIALAIVTTGAVSLAALSAQAGEIVARARRQALATMLADGEVARLQGRGLAATAPDCLTRDVAGCVTFVDAQGQSTADPRAPFAVRWSATPFMFAPSATVLVVCAVSGPERSPTTGVPGVCVARMAMAGVP